MSDHAEFDQMCETNASISFRCSAWDREGSRWLGAFVGLSVRFNDIRCRLAKDAMLRKPLSQKSVSDIEP
jgi:hypothetical protein